MRWDEWKALNRMTDNNGHLFSGTVGTLTRYHTDRFRLTYKNNEVYYSNTDPIHSEERLVLRDLYEEWYRREIDNLPF